MKHENKFSRNQQQSQELGSAQQNEQAVREFASAEDLLRFDAAHTPVPAGLVQRLAKSAESIPRPKRSWWARLFQK